MFAARKPSIKFSSSNSKQMFLIVFNIEILLSLFLESIQCLTFVRKSGSFWTMNYLPFFTEEIFVIIWQKKWKHWDDLEFMYAFRNILK